MTITNNWMGLIIVYALWVDLMMHHGSHFEQMRSDYMTGMPPWPPALGALLNI